MIFNSTYTGTNEDNGGTIGGVNNYEDENYNDENYEEEYDENWEDDNDDKITIAFMKGKRTEEKKSLHMRETRTHIDDVLLQSKRQTWKRTKQRLSATTQLPTTRERLSTTTAFLSTTLVVIYHSQYNKGYGKHWSSGYNKGGKKGQLPAQQINDNDSDYYSYEEDPSSWDYSYNQERFPETDYPQQLPGQEVEQQQVLQQQQSSPLTMGSLYEIDAIIHIGRQSPRHLKDFWSIIIDTGAAISVCPMTFCEHIAVKSQANARFSTWTIRDSDRRGLDY
eukprot:6490407-Amphidinium_carterae.3